MKKKLIEIVSKLIASIIIILACILFSLLAWEVGMHGEINSRNAFWVMKYLAK